MHRAVGEIKFPGQDSVLVAHRNERHSPSKGQRFISKLRRATSPQAALHLASHYRTPRRLCRQANRPKLAYLAGLSVPAPSRQRPTFVGLVPCLAARKRKAHRGKPLCTICIGAKLLYRFGGVSRGHSGVGGRSGCQRSPTLAVTRPGEAGSVRPRS